MDKTTTSWVSYLTPIGWIIAYLVGDKEKAKFYLNQSLIIWIASLILYIARMVLILIPFLGVAVVFAAEVFLVIVWIMGLINAFSQEEKEIPLIGSIKILK